MKTKPNWLLPATITMFILSLAACDSSRPVDDSYSPVGATAAKAPEPPKVATESITPIYPDAAATSELKLDYVTFQRVDDDGVSAVPLPPFVQAKTKLHLAPNATGFDVVAGNGSCVGPMALSVNDEEVAVLDPAKGVSNHHLTVDVATAPQGVELAVAMAPSVEANFNCNITIRPVGAHSAG